MAAACVTTAAVSRWLSWAIEASKRSKKAVPSVAPGIIRERSPEPHAKQVPR
jgi:hypothetical protein